MKRGALLSVLLILLIGSAGLYLWYGLLTPYPPAPGQTLLEIPKGIRTREVVGLLYRNNVIRNRYLALGYIFYAGFRHRLQAGEYLFDRPMTIPQVVGKIAGGNVYLHKFTVPEGVSVSEIALKWQEQDFGTAEDLNRTAANSLDLIRDWDPEAISLEGYLFPETYLFSAHTTARQALATMVDRFRMVLKELQKDAPVEKWPLKVKDTVTLASLVEAEAAREEERTLIASVFLNRLGKNILLQCDPTVIYALERAERYKGQLTLADLRFNSPYNTYVHLGLPPGPITNPGYPSLRAAVRPASTNYLFFVRTTEGHHTFSETLAEHQEAVARYHLLQRSSH
jgi:UPF0755 protein